MKHDVLQDGKIAVRAVMLGLPALKARHQLAATSLHLSPSGPGFHFLIDDDFGTVFLGVHLQFEAMGGFFLSRAADDLDGLAGGQEAVHSGGADTDALDLAPQAAGLLAASLGLSRMYRDDLAQLDAAMGLYDAFYRWARDAVGETHNWPTPRS